MPWAYKKAEAEIRKAFEKTMHVRKLGKEASGLADYWFFETVVRLHREGEGAPYTGIKPVGLDTGPVVPRAEKAIEKGNPKELIEFLQNSVKEEIEEKFRHVMATKNYNENDVDSAREYVRAMLDLTLYSHYLYTSIKQSERHGEGTGGHGH